VTRTSRGGSEVDPEELSRELPTSMRGFETTSLFFLLFHACSSLLFQVSRVTNKGDLEKCILLRFPLVTKLDEQLDLISLYLPRLQKKGAADDEEVDTFVAKDKDNQIVGALHITKKSLFIQDLTVDERLRRLGIATALLLHAFAEATKTRKDKVGDSPAAVVSLMVDNKNRAARNLYESLGFTYSGSNPFHTSNFCPRLLIPFSRQLGKAK